MFKKILHITFFLALAATVAAQNPYVPGNLQGGPPAPGTRSRSPLNSLERAANNLAGATILTDTFGNQRLALFVRIEDTCINYTPAATGNTQNLSAFVEKCATDSVWYIDWEGKSQFIGGAGAVCDEDWLQISDNACPDAITDSIYHYRYAAIGARLVWPSAEFLVSDSSAAQVTVLSGNRNSRLAFWDNFNAVYSTIDQSGTSSVWYISPIGEMRWTTAGGGTPQVPGAPFVNQFAINPADSPLPTIQAHQYPNTRSDTATVRNFLYTDPVGEFRSQPIDSLVVIVVDSIQADTTLQRNWYTHNGVTTDLLRTALVKRSAWWRGIDSVGFFRFSVRPDLVNGTQVTMYQDSLVFDADTVLWRSTWHPALQFHDLGAESTYFYADSLKVVGIGQFPGFPALSLDGTDKGFLYDIPNTGLYVINGDGTSGAIAYSFFGPAEIQDYVQSDPLGDDFVQLNRSATSTEAVYDYEVESSDSEYGRLLTRFVSSDDENLFGVQYEPKDTNLATTLYLGSASLSQYYTGRRAFGVRTEDGENFDFDWLQSYLPNDTTENAVSFYNRAYYWKNEHPTGVAGDTIFHYWAEDGVNAGKNPGFMTLDQVCAHCSESAVNWYNSDGTTTDNTRIADVLETATWRSNDVTVDGVYPFRFELDGIEANEPEMMVWRFPAPNNDSLVLNQSDQEITFRSTNRFLLWANEALVFLGDSIQAQGIADKTKIRRLLGISPTTAIQSFDADALAAGTVIASDGTDWVPSTATGLGYVLQNGNSFGTTMTIGTNDNNAFNFETNNVVRHAIDTEGKQVLTASVANTSTVANMVTMQTNSTGTAAAGFGGGILFQAESSTTDNRDIAYIRPSWTVATDASRTSQIQFGLALTGAALANYGTLSPSGLSGLTGGGATNYGNSSINLGANFTIGNSSNTLALSTSASSVNAILLNSTNDATSNSVTLGNSNFTTTTGTKYDLRATGGYAPTSGTGLFYNLRFNPTINQTGGANGATGAVIFEPTLTAIGSKWSALTSATSNSNALFINQTGANSYSSHVGAFGFGSATVPTDKLEVTGNLALLTAGNKIKIATGSNASVGTSAAMTAGSITINTTAVTANSIIFLTHATLGGTQGILSVGTITAGTSFVINSSSATDTGTVNWFIIN